MLKKLENESFDDVVKHGSWLVDFSATWCGPCKMLELELEEVKNEINILQIDVDKHSDLASKFGIMSVPTLLVYKEGEIVKQSVGYKDKDELLELMK